MYLVLAMSVSHCNCNTPQHPTNLNLPRHTHRGFKSEGPKCRIEKWRFHFGSFQLVAYLCGSRERDTVCCSVLQCVTVCCSVLQCVLQ